MSERIITDENKIIRPIARIHTDFPDKFGIPRQSNLINSLRGQIVFEPAFRDANALREIEQYSHLWLIWGFSANKEEEFHPTVRPPRLGGNTRVGVFASRSPFRPNSLGLSVVKLEKVDYSSEKGPVIEVSGIDMLDGTPIYDIKPYLPYVDSVPGATDGFALNKKEGSLNVTFLENLYEAVPAASRDALTAVLSQDPRPQYQEDPSRIYKMDFAGMNVSFSVSGDTLCVVDVKR